MLWVRAHQGLRRSLNRLRDAIARAATRHPSDLPSALLEAASRTGRCNDMTVVALRVGAG